MELAVRDVRKALQSLPDDQRRTLELYFREGYTLGEIAVELGQSKGNVRQHFCRGLEKLRKQMFPGPLKASV